MRMRPDHVYLHAKVAQCTQVHRLQFTTQAFRYREADQLGRTRTEREQP